MERYRTRDMLEYVQYMKGTLPKKFQEMIIGTHFVTDYDPAFLGLHFYKANSDDGRSYNETGHTVYPCHQEHMPACDRRTTVVLFDGKDDECFYHEIGHAIHDRSDFIDIAKPLDDYAERNHREAFVTSFQAYMAKILGYDYRWYCTREQLWKKDRKMFEFFKSIEEARA